ncbi:hypothetical protein ASZ90_007642 [hydrocarbon metagenome]|uniref:Uncharacterized protein n=1 Tax=hydrocarbon metagenome TaxID=938273 RepID=A0A0W8FP97_9ZZZZ
MEIMADVFLKRLILLKSYIVCFKMKGFDNNSCSQILDGIQGKLKLYSFMPMIET